MTAKRPAKKLTAKQERFCREYCVDLNATGAAVRSGYSENTSQMIGSENLCKPMIIARLAELTKEKVDKADISAQMVLDGIKSIAEDPDARHNDKLKAYELLGKYLKLFTDRIELKASVAVTMVSMDDL